MVAEQEPGGINDAEAMAALESFVVDNDDLLELESHIGRFNIFDALRIGDAEIRHSNFLAFLLDPAESHGQGPLFLKPILMDLLKEAPAENRPFSPVALDGTDLRAVEVRREWQHIDVLIRCKEPSFNVVIENKVRSKEGPDQLRDYEEAIKKHYPTVRTLYVYLTLTGEDPSRKDWIPYSYEALHEVLTRVRDVYFKTIGDEVLAFLDHYLNLIGTRFMNNPEIDDLCQRIYKNHRRALELIIERGRPMSGVLAEAAAVLEEDRRWEVVARPTNGLDFMLKEWLVWLPPLALRANSRSWIYVSLSCPGDRLLCAVNMAPMSDPTKRIEIAAKLLDQCHAFGFKRPKGRQLKNNYSRVSAAETILKWEEDEEPDSDAIRPAVKKMLDDLYPKLEKMALVLKPLCGIPAAAR